MKGVLDRRGRAFWRHHHAPHKDGCPETIADMAARSSKAEAMGRNAVAC